MQQRHESGLAVPLAFGPRRTRQRVKRFEARRKTQCLHRISPRGKEHVTGRKQTVATGKSEPLLIRSRVNASRRGLRKATENRNGKPAEVLSKQVKHVIDSLTYSPVVFTYYLYYIPIDTNEWLQE